MKIIGGMILVIGMVIIFFSIFIEKIFSINTTNLTNVRMTTLAWGTFISFSGLYIAFGHELNGK